MSYELDEPKMISSTVGIIVGPVFLILVESFVFGPGVFAALAFAVSAAAWIFAGVDKRIGLALFIAVLWSTAIVITIHAVEVLT